MLGKLTRLLYRSVAVRDNVRFGSNLHVGPGSRVWAPTGLDIGNNVYVGKYVTIEVDGRIGDEVLIANSVSVVGRLDHDYRKCGTPVRSADWVGNVTSLSKPIIVGSDVWIGANCTVLSGIRIGNSSIIAAGSVVVKDVPDNSIVGGVPGKVIDSRFSESRFEKHWIALRKLNVQWIP